MNRWTDLMAMAKRDPGKEPIPLEPNRREARMLQWEFLSMHMTMEEALQEHDPFQNAFPATVRHHDALWVQFQQVIKGTSKRLVA